MTTAADLTLERRLAKLAVADAPEFTGDQIIEIRRVLKPYVAGLRPATPVKRDAGAGAVAA